MSTDASGGYEPGTVAALSIGSEDVRGIVREGEWLIVGHSFFKSIAVGNGTLIQSVRPLVVLDLDGIAPEAIVKALRDKDAGTNGTGWARVADQIEAQTKPPRIPEPGLWGVVEAGTKKADRRAWVRVHDDLWIADGAPLLDAFWADLTDPTLVRPGIEDVAS